VLGPRGVSGHGDPALWRVRGINRADGGRVASLFRTTTDSSESREVAVEDLVVVAEFRDAIYPGLESTGKLERGGDKPFHTVINAENFHALQALLYTHRGAVDVVYIDPPYNTGARDWKYNNDYVEGDDLYRHSKWLAFMERRLFLARELLKPDDSVLIVTIDEKEYLRLGLLLEQVFPEARIQMVSSVIAQKGVARTGQFYRTDEYIFFVQIGDARVLKQSLGEDWKLGKGDSAAAKGIVWSQLRRSGTNALRQDRPSLFYPIFVDPQGPSFHSVGVPIALNTSPDSVEAPEGTVAVWPIRPDGEEANWQVSHTALRSLIDDGYVRLGKQNENGYPISYLKRGSIQKIQQGAVSIVGRHEVDGHVLVDSESYEHSFVPGSQWNIASHDASYHGSQLLNRLIGQDRFPFPKSLYAVEDALRFFVSDKPEAVILDFFAGSGTTAHAVMRLNKQDDGRRQSISVTNNEVSAAEQADLMRGGFRPGDPEWEALGIATFVTRPRLEAVVTGRTPAGEPVVGEYRFNDVFPIAEGLPENVEFFSMNYNTPASVSHNRAFASVAPLLWMRAGSRGRRIGALPTDTGWDVADAYGVLANLDNSRQFTKALSKAEDVRLAYIVTDDDRRFQMVCAALPEHVQPVRLYESYLLNFEINTGIPT
jgi:adenine-specific DNA-methyltransferase